MRARRILDTKTGLADGRIIQRKVWKLPQPSNTSPHALKYRLYCGKDGRTIVRYDNETGKGDHRHIGPKETQSFYVFVSLVQLFTDFDKDIERLSGEIK